MAPRPIRDEWLLPTLEGILPPERIAALKAEATESYWESAVRRGLISEEALLESLAKRFRMRVANVMSVTQAARELVPEQLARKYRVLPLAITDSTLDIATADPHDLDCERTLAFATGRTVDGFQRRVSEPSCCSTCSASMSRMDFGTGGGRFPRM